MKEAVVRIDLDVAHWFASVRSVPLNEFFLVVTQLGSAWFILAFSVIAAVYFWWRMQSYFLPFLASVVGTSLTVTLIKEVVERARPSSDLAFYAEHLFSFPSGHSASALAGLGFIAYALARTSQRKAYKALIIGAAALLIALIGASRLYLGVHYASDVIAGFLVGGAWLTLSLLAHRHRMR